MRFYPTAARLSFQRLISYRSAAVAGVLTNTVFGFIRAYILLALWAEKPQLGGYSAADAVTDVFLVQGMLTPLGIFSLTTDLGPRIRTGDVAVDLYRPCDFQGWFLALDVGRAGAALALRGLPPVLLGALFFPVGLPADPRRWLLFALSCGLGLLTSFAIRYLISLSAFWTMDERGAASLLSVVSMFCSGMILPLEIMPGWLASTCYALPWAATLQTPINLLLGRQDGGAAAALGVQALWAAVLLGIGRLVTAAARHKVVVQGG